MINGWFEWVNFFCYMQCLGDNIIKAMSSRCFDLPLRLPKCWSFRMSHNVLTCLVKLLNDFRLMLLGLRLMIQINLIRKFRMLMITKILDCGGFQLHLLIDIIFLAWIIYKFTMQHRRLHSYQEIFFIYLQAISP